RIAVVGCGRIAGQYLWSAQQSPHLEVVACAALNVEVARAKATEFNIAKACTVAEVLADPAIELIEKLTTPKSHASITLAALRAGKHVYTEKPLAVTREEGLQLLEGAKARNLHLGCAPDTFLGSGVQTARRLIDQGAIGRPLALTAFMMCRGHESW